MTKRAILLLSGGQDSTTCLGWAFKQREQGAWDEVIALSLFYGQRHASELEAAKKIAKRFEVQHIVENIPVLGAIGGSALVDASKAIEGSGGYGDHAMPQGLPTSFVPGRNLLFLVLAAAYAVKVGAKDIITGVCQTDYSGYPDCREEFVKAANGAINLAMPSEAGPFTIHTPLMHLTKGQTVKLALSLGGPTWGALGDSVTCYHGQHPGCGRCPACELRVMGFADAGMPDPQFDNGLRASQR